MRGAVFAAGRAVRGDCTGVAQKCGGPVDGALGRGKADGSGDSGDAESGESSVSARPAGADEGQLAGRADAAAGGTRGGNGRMSVSETDTAAGAAVLYGEPEPQRAGGDGAAGAGCLSGAAHGIFCAGEPAFRGWAGADRVGGAEPGREEMDAGCAWNRRVRTQLSDGRNTGRSVGFGSGCMLGDRAAINTTNSGHKIICENSKKGVDKRLLL